MEKQTLGMIIASSRKEHALTQLELAEKMGVTDKAVSKWERNLSCPDVNTLPKLAELFGMSVDELLQANLEVQLSSKRKDTYARIRKMLTLILKAVSVATGVAVIVLSTLKEIDMYSGFCLLGIGLACVGLVMLQNEKEELD